MLTIYFANSQYLSNQDTRTTSSFNFFLRAFRKEAGFNDNRLAWDGSLAKNFTISGLQCVNDGDLFAFSLGSRQSEKLLQVNSRAMILVVGQVEVAHTKLTKVSRMKSVKQSAMVKQTTSVTAASWMLTVLSNTTMTGTNVSAKLAGLLQS